VSDLKKQLRDKILPKPDYALGEEIVNSITHGLGTLFAIAAPVLLVVRAAQRGTAWHVVSFAIFGATLILLYLFSTLYHSITHRTAKQVFARMDHSAIFLLIAGTYTPIMLTVLRGPWGWTFFGLIWGMALLGIVIRSIWLTRFRMLATVMYAVMGWSFLIAYNEIIVKVPPLSLRFLLYGGLAYTVGILFYIWKKQPYAHSVWHLFVIAGSVLHFFAVFYLL
jgi:hemolysin III